MMPATQFCVTNKRGTYLCTVRALVFEGSILMYNPALNEAKWIPTGGLANNLSWAEERSMVALANYVPCTLKEVERVARLGVGRMVSCPGNDSSTMSMEGEEESQFSDAPSTGPHMDMDREAGKESKEPVGSKEEASGQMNPGKGAEASPHIDQCWCSQNWESIMEESAGLAYDDPCPSSDTNITGVDSPSVPPLSSHDESGGSPPTRLRVPPLTHQGHPWKKCHCWCPQLPCQFLVWTQWRSTSPSQSWTTCKVEACIWALPGHVRTVVRGRRRWRVEASAIYSQFIL